jgi:hypothetical protein
MVEIHRQPDAAGCLNRYDENMKRLDRKSTIQSGGKNGDFF